MTSTVTSFNQTDCRGSILKYTVNKNTHIFCNKPKHEKKKRTLKKLDRIIRKIRGSYSTHDFLFQNLLKN